MTLIGTTIQGKSGQNNGNEGVLLRASKLEPHDLIQFSIIPCQKTLKKIFFLKEILPYWQDLEYTGLHPKNKGILSMTRNFI